jgi:hypothetical protein
MTKRGSKILVGDLLVKSELITLAQFADAMPVSLKTGLPVGRVLIASGFLTEEGFKNVLTVQSLIRDHLISQEAGIEALKLTKLDKSLSEALDQLGESCDFFESTNRLGELLFDAEIIDNETLSETLSVSLTTGLPLARVLSMRGAIAEEVAFIALCCQSLIREGVLDRESAVNSIKLVRQNLAHLKNLGLSSKPGAISLKKANSLRLGELLLLSGMVDDNAIVQAVQEGLTDEQPLGKVLTRVGIISEVELGQALAIQEMINNRTLSPDDATFVLATVKGSGMSLSKALSESDKQKSQAEEKGEPAPLDVFLSFLGVNIPQLGQLKEQSQAENRPLADYLHNQGLLNPAIEEPVFQCYKHYLSGRLDDDQCAFAVHMLACTDLSDLELLLKQLSW